MKAVIDRSLPQLLNLLLLWIFHLTIKLRQE